ncbi:ATP-grasp domain-containing protein [Longimicrobium sp.]|uniref:ATP-grasp domain-containing protein n=1 Tax=Longimicrobium sp. TaxID=2029185 RepID=UPI002ED7D70B
MSAEKALLFVESNTSGTGRLFARTARTMGFAPVLITARPEKYAYLAEADAPEVVVVPRVDEDELHALVAARWGGAAGVAGITSSSEYFIATAAALAARFGLPGPEAASVRAARDKSWQRQVLAAGGVPSPAFRAVSSAPEAVAAAREIGFPVVLKPVDGSGSVGVRACASEGEVQAHAAALLATAGENARLLVEGFVTGPEFSVEMFSGRVVGITRKHLGTPPFFVEAGHDYPASVPADVARALADSATRGTELLGLGWGPLHWELRVDAGGCAVPMEVNPRLAGGFIPELVRHAQGIDLIRETLRLVVGQTPEVTPVRHRHASIRFLFPPADGRLDAVEGIDGARGIEGVVDVALYRSVGDPLVVHGDFRDRIGHVMACADGFDAASEAAERARDTVRLRVDLPAAAPLAGAREGAA